VPVRGPGPARGEKRGAGAGHGRRRQAVGSRGLIGRGVASGAGILRHSPNRGGAAGRMGSRGIAGWIAGWIHPVAYERRRGQERLANQALNKSLPVRFWLLKNKTQKLCRAGNQMLIAAQTSMVESKKETPFSLVAPWLGISWA
jgi:hypothetical protein